MITEIWNKPKQLDFSNIRLIMYRIVGNYVNFGYYGLHRGELCVASWEIMGFICRIVRNYGNYGLHREELLPVLNVQSGRSTVGLGRVEDAWTKCLL